MQAGGGVGVFVPAQAILVARMPADRLVLIIFIILLHIAQNILHKFAQI
jgi:hypothetical protein